MKIIIHLLPLLLLPLLSIGQNSFDYTISRPYPVIDGQTKLYFSDITTEKALSIKIDSKDVYLQNFDTKNMKETGRKKYSDLLQDNEFEHATWVQDRLYFFYSHLDRTKENKQIIARQIDFDKCQFVDNGNVLFSIKGKKADFSTALFGKSTIETAGSFSFNLSRDKSKLLIQYRKAPEVKIEKQNYDVLGMYVFDKEMNKLAGNEIKMPYTEKKMDNVDFAVDSEGTPYMLAKVYKDGSTKDSRGSGDNKKANYIMELFKVDIPNKSIKTTKIELTNNFIKDSWLYEGNENTIYCTGLYNKMIGGQIIGGNTKEDNADGVFLFRLDKEGGIIDKNFYEIPLEILNQYTRSGGKKVDEKKDKDDKSEFAYLELMEVYNQSDGSLIILGEQRFLVESYSSRGQIRTTVYRNDILMTKIDTTGNLVWMKKLPKRQAGSRFGNSLSFKRLTINGIHYLFFIDNDRNLKLSLNERPARHIEGLGGLLTAYCINDQTGEVQKRLILNPAKLKNGMEVYQFGIDRILKISNAAFFIEFYKKGKEDVFLKVDVK